MTSKIKDFLFKDINPIPLSIFRVLFGLVLIYQFSYCISIDYAYQFITGPEILFKYPLLQFLEPASTQTLNLLLYLMLIASVFITLGFKTKWFSIFLFFTFFYITFIDQTLYNNHLYLFAVIIGLFIFIESDKTLSISNLINKNTQKNIKNWQLFIFQFIIFCTYFYGGIAKLNQDWLSGNIPELLLSSKVLNPPQTLIYFITFGGVLFDLSIGFLLWNKRTFLYVLFPILLFNIMNGLFLFDDIGVFPYFMIGATILFLPKSILELFIKPLENQQNKNTSSSKNQKTILICVSIFVIFNLLFPLRHYFLTYHPEWTGIASKFAWRMKMQSNNVVSAKFYITDSETNISHPVEYETFLSNNQILHFFDDPIYIVQLAHYLEQVSKDRGMQNPAITSDIQISMNGRPVQSMIRNDIDLTKVPINRWEVAKILEPLVK